MTASGSKAPARSDHGDSRGAPSLDQLAEQLVARRARRRGDQRGDREEHRAEQRAACQPRAELLDGDRLIDQRAADAAVGFGHGQPEHAELAAEPRPHLRVERRIGLHQPPDLLLVEVLGAELAHRVAQLRLLVGEPELARTQPRGISFHGMPASARRSPGSPRMRSPRMLRITSDVPPSMVLARLRRNRCWMGPCQSALAGGGALLVAVVQKPFGPKEIHAELVDVLIQLGADQLADRPLRARAADAWRRRASVPR